MSTRRLTVPQRRRQIEWAANDKGSSPMTDAQFRAVHRAFGVEPSTPESDEQEADRGGA